MLSYCTLKIHVPGGGFGTEALPYHADDGSFVLVPSSKTRPGWWVTGIPNILPYTKRDGLVVLSWMSCHFGEKQSNPFHFVPVGDRLNITQAGLWCRYHLTEPVTEYLSVSHWKYRTKRQTWPFVPPWDDWWFPSSLRGDCWSKIFCPRLVTVVTWAGKRIQWSLSMWIF